MSKVVVIGYASIDYPAVLDGFFKGDRTVMIKERPADAFPRAGGSPLYVARPVATLHGETSIITWIGDDQLGEFFRDQVTEGGVITDGVAIISPGNTPVCFLLYQQDGSCGCCFDPGMLGREALDLQQIDLIQGADLLCITVGPPQIGMRSLELISDECLIVWVAKNDPLSYPEELRQALGSKADFIFCNSHEREWIDSATQNRKGTNPVIIETNGAKPVKIEYEGKAEFVEVPQLIFNDASGAGDTLAGGCLKVIAAGETNPRSIVEAGIEAASQMLQQRTIDKGQNK